MFRLVVAAAGFIFLVASHADAGQSGYYLGASSGLMLLTNTLTDREGSTGDLSYEKIGLPVSIYFGRQLGSGLRVEEEIFYKTATTKEFDYSGVKSKIDSNVRAVGAMTNLYYDWFHDVKALADGPYSPYIGLGAGFANVHMSEGSVDVYKFWNSGNDTAFAFQIAVGSAIPVYKDLSLDVSYRYLGTTNVKIDQIDTSFNTHNFLLGVRYLFK